MPIWSINSLAPAYQQPCAGIECRLGELDGADIVLHDLQLRRTVMQQIGEGAAIGLDAWRDRGHAAVDDAILGDDAGQEHLRQALDDA
jgi:hypothetical protein